MESKELRALLIEGIKKIETPKGYKEIISRKNNLYKFDIINRLLIVGQSENAFDVRTQEEWEINGRGVLNNRNKIFIIIPNIKSEYKDTETLESIDVSEFTPDELNKALSLGVINRTDVVNNIHTSIVYDIRNTQSLNNGEYSIDKLRIKQSDIFRIAQNILKCNITKSELNYYSNTDDTLYIKNNDEYSNIATYTIDVIVNTCVNQYIDIIKNNYVNDTVDITEYDIELLSNTVKYVMYELFNIEEYIDLDIVRHTNTDKLILILNIADCIINRLIACTDCNDKVSIDAIHSINVYRKAEALLDIMEANKLHNKMKGA